MLWLLAYNFANKGLCPEYFPVLGILLGQYFLSHVRTVGSDRLF